MSIISFVVCDSTLTTYSTPQLPVGGRVATNYQASTGEGAILVTDGPVNEAQALPINAMCKWMNDNAERIMAAKPDAKSHNLWLVTKTYSAEKRALAILRTKEDNVQLMVDANAAGVGRAGATAEWWRGSKDNAWNVFEHVSLIKGVRISYLRALTSHHRTTALFLLLTAFVTTGSGIRSIPGLITSISQGSLAEVKVILR
jgi:hypothetical protein